MGKIIAITSQPLAGIARDSYIIVTWRMLLRCNLDCSYCGPWLHDLTSDVPNYEKLSKAAIVLNEHAKSVNKKIYYFLTGGEPYLIKDFNKLLKFIKGQSQTLEINVSSNATVPVRIYKESLQYVNQLVLSLHLEVDLNAVEEKVKTVNELSNEFPSNVTAMVMLEKGFFSQAQDIANTLKNNNVKYWLKLVQPQLSTNEISFNPPLTSGKLVSDNAKSHLISNYASIISDYYTTEEQEIVKTLAGIEEGNNVLCLWDNNTKSVENVTTLLSNGTNSFKGWECHAGILQIEIFHDGGIHVGACAANGAFGNIYTEDILWPNATIECPLNYCVCTTDITAPKRNLGKKYTPVSVVTK